MATPSTNLYICNLPTTWTKPELELAFAPYGTIESSTVLMNGGTGISRGIGFVRYSTNESCVAAMKGMDGKMPEGAVRPLNVQYAKSASSGGSSSYGPSRHSSGSSRYSPYGTPAPAAGKDQCNLYACDIPTDMDKPSFKAMFEPYGAVASSTILLDHKTGLSRGIGFCRFEDPSSAQAALAALNGFTPSGADRAMTVTYARDTSMKTAAATAALNAALGTVAAAPTAGVYGYPVTEAPTLSYDPTTGYPAAAAPSAYLPAHAYYAPTATAAAPGLAFYNPYGPPAGEAGAHVALYNPYAQVAPAQPAAANGAASMPANGAAAASANGAAAAPQYNPYS